MTCAGALESASVVTVKAAVIAGALILVASIVMMTTTTLSPREAAPMPAEAKHCDFCGGPILGRGERFCGHRCMREYGRRKEALFKRHSKRIKGEDVARQLEEERLCGENEVTPHAP
jgi:hypothetical protein